MYGTEYAFFKGSSDAESDDEVDSYIMHNADGSMTTKGQTYSEFDVTDYVSEGIFCLIKLTFVNVILNWFRKFNYN